MPGLLLRNWQLKLSALALAILLWIVPRFETPSRQVLEGVPVRIQVNDPNWAVRGEPFPERVRVTLVGPARVLLALAEDRPSLVVPVERVSSSDTAILLRPSWLRIPDRAGVEVEALQPASVRVSFEPITLVVRPLALPMVGEPPEPWSVAGPPELSPPWVRILGPVSVLEGVDSVLLRPVELGRLAGDSPFPVPVDTGRLKGIVVSPTHATVRIPLGETEERRLVEVPVQVPSSRGEPPPLVSPSTVNLTLVGARSLVAGVRESEVRVVVRPEVVGALPPGTEERVPVVVEGVPSWVRARADPQWVVLRRPGGG